MTTTIDITSDFICPWCWIGHQNLKSALALAGVQDALRIRYLPFELNADMPVQGMNRQAYRSAKFGNWARSQSMDEDVTQAGKLVGLDFHYERIAVTPNTRLAHRLMAYAQSSGDSDNASALFGAIFSGYFAEGLDIGNRNVLLAIAARVGLDTVAARDFLAGTAGEKSVDAALARARNAGIHSVPNLLIDGLRVEGAQSAESLAGILRQLQVHHEH
ncbi:DsbA family oxidoreductase [Pseudoduganella sp. FT26W]|uniref:DsbA family oxidoreductase n=1 Tax=Duganella aquatilis TaxID=2666082 RepID=A0A844CPQ0_9BURK|nr:DsbA family oxidoreductase [Duganella aquatilis]MRW82677.1 DsbA family oxidoreductase [Duganella aquatilis]